jgi:hypothetical protein
MSIKYRERQADRKFTLSSRVSRFSSLNKQYSSPACGAASLLAGPIKNVESAMRGPQFMASLAPDLQLGSTL